MNKKNIDNNTVIGSYRGQSYNLNLLKFIAAIAVIFSHAFSIVRGDKLDVLFRITGGQLSFGGFAVAIFFFASGFFVTRSIKNKNSDIFFWKARFGKIYPAFILVIILTVFVMGPLITNYSIPEYFSSQQTYAYLLYLLMIPKYELPGVFINNPTHIVNGSLWTLVLEMICYVGLFITYKMGMLEKKMIKKLNILLGVVIVFLFIIRPKYIYTFHNYYRPLFVFIMGMEYSIFQNEIYINKKRVLVSATIGLVLIALGYMDLFIVLIFPYLLSSFIFAKRQIGKKIAEMGKYSYAIYLVAFPIQQLLVDRFPGINVITNTMLTTMLSLLLGILIYHFVEVPCAKKIVR